MKYKIKFNQKSFRFSKHFLTNPKSFYDLKICLSINYKADLFVQQIKRNIKCHKKTSFYITQKIAQKWNDCNLLDYFNIIYRKGKL